MIRAAALVCLIGCATDEPPVDVGVWGQLTYSSDVCPCGPKPEVDETVSAFASTDLVAQTTTNTFGMFALELPAGSYVVCAEGRDPSSLGGACYQTTTVYCANMEVTEHAIRADWHHDFGGGGWSVGPHCP